jgi:hypothetical protein
MSDTITTSRRPWPIWMRIPCPSWCISVHSDGDALDDRQCFGGYRNIARSLAEPIEVVVPGGTRQQMDDLRVGLEAEFRELVPHLLVGYGSGLMDDPDSAYYSLTLTEAADLAGIIQDLVRAARQDAPAGAFAERHVDLSLEETLTAQDEWFLDAVHVSVEQGTPENGPKVLLYLGDGRGVEFTPGEAEEYAAALLDLVAEGASLDISALRIEAKDVLRARSVARHG